MEEYGIKDIPFPRWKEPVMITKEELEMFIKEFKKNPEMFKKDMPRW